MSWRTRKGNNIYFWDDVWIREVILKEVYNFCKFNSEKP